MRELEIGLGTFRIILARDRVRVKAIDATIERGWVTVDLDNGECIACLCGSVAPDVAENAFWSVAAAEGALDVQRH